MKTRIPPEISRELETLRRQVQELKGRVGEQDILGITPDDREGKISSFRAIKTGHNEYGIGFRTRDGWVVIGGNRTTPTGQIPPSPDSIGGSGPAWDVYRVTDAEATRKLAVPVVDTVITYINLSSGQVTIDGDGVNINQQATVVLSSYGASVTLYSDGEQYYVIHAT